MSGEGDEISLLAHNFNRMADAVSRHLKDIEAGRHDIEQLNLSLEETVQRRTQELAGKNVELGKTIEFLQETRASLIRSEKLASLGRAGGWRGTRNEYAHRQRPDRFFFIA